MKSPTQSTWFERVYKVGIAIKGFDGLVELIAGLALLISPKLVHTVLSTISGRASHYHWHVSQYVVEYIARLDGTLAKSGLTFLIMFLIGHGVVKIVLVYCLLKEIIKVYPYALAVLGLFLVYQVYVLLQDPVSIGMWLFTILDIVIIYLVWGEWRQLLRKNGIISVDAKDTSVL